MWEAKFICGVARGGRNADSPGERHRERLFGLLAPNGRERPRWAEVPEILTRSDSDGAGACLALATQNVAL